MRLLRVSIATPTTATLAMRTHLLIAILVLAIIAAASAMFEPLNSAGALTAFGVSGTDGDCPGCSTLKSCIICGALEDLYL